MEQLALDLFGETEHEDKRLSPLEYFLSWAHDTHGCGDAVDETARDVFKRMPDAFDRCKALVTVFRCGRDGSEVVPLLGLFDDIDYHVSWDRAWAYVHGVPLELIGRIHSCDYRCGSGKHAFRNEGGEVIWECEGNE